MVGNGCVGSFGDSGGVHSVGQCDGGGGLDDRDKEIKQRNRTLAGASACLHAQRRWSHAALAGGAKEDFCQCEGSGRRTRMLEALTIEFHADEQGAHWWLPIDF